MSETELNTGICIWTPNKANLTEDEKWDIIDECYDILNPDGYNYRKPAYSLKIQDDYVIFMKRLPDFEGLFISDWRHNQIPNEMVETVMKKYHRLGIPDGYHAVMFTMLHYNGSDDYFIDYPRWNDLFRKKDE
jgi:hypothetical protein